MRTRIYRPLLLLLALLVLSPPLIYPQICNGLTCVTSPINTLSNQIVSGCGVEYLTGLQFQVGACTYSINGTVYTSPLTLETLSAADPTNPRIDVIGVDTTSTVFVITGTPAVTPLQPTTDPSTQLGLTFIYIPAASSTPSGVSIQADIFEENLEWTTAVTSNIAVSTNSPYRGSKDIEATNAVLGNNVTFTKPASGTVDLANANNLVFYIRSKGQWPTGKSGATAARYLSIWWQNAGVQKGNQVVLRDGIYGFYSSITNAYQQVSIPTSLFAANGIPVTTLVMQISGSSGSSTIGWYVDSVTLQGGINQPPSSTSTMNYRGTWSSTTTYNANDVVTLNGASYVALVANTNVSVTTTTTWAPLGSAKALYSLFPLSASLQTATLAKYTTTGSYAKDIVLQDSGSDTGTAVGRYQYVPITYTYGN